MATISTTAVVTPALPRFGSLRRMVRDSWLMLLSHIRHFLAQPGQIVATIAMPIVFIVLFGYVFGSAIAIPGVDNYREYLMPGIFAQTAAFTMVAAAVGMAEMKEKGQMDRFRSLPMSRAAVLIGQTLYQLLNTVVGVIVMAICALGTGWRVHTDIVHAAGGFGLLVLFALATNFVGVCIGMLATDAKMADQIMMVVTMPMTFLANVFIAPEGLPSWLKPIANWNPLSPTVAAMRDLFGNAPTITPANQPWPLEHPVFASLAGSILLIAIALPLSVRVYRRQE